MYITINGVRYDNVKRMQTAQRVTYISSRLTADIVAEGSVVEYRNDGFLLREVDVSGYARQIAKDGVLTLTNEAEPVKTPAEVREDAYMNDACIEYGGESITVDEANKLYLQYLAEGNTEKTSALTALIAEAKARIRAEFPDEEVTEHDAS